MQQVMQAADILSEKGIAADIYSVTSYSLLYREAIECESWNRDHPEKTSRVPYVRCVLSANEQPVIAATDYMKVLPASIANWVPGELICLGTDGYGLSESRPVLRDHFGISADAIAKAALAALD
jgi:pyruvate dehydrogenase E1 component